MFYRFFSSTLFFSALCINLSFAQSASLPNISTYQGAQIEIALSVNELPPLESLDFSFNYDSEVIEIQVVTYAGGILEGFQYSLFYNVSETGLNVTVYLSGGEWASGNGEILFFTIEAIAATGSSTGFNFTQFLINDTDFLENTSNGSVNITEPSFGCTDSDACNYDSSATDEDGSCIFEDCAGSCTCENEDSTGGEDCLVIDLCNECGGNNDCVGCMDTSACNYDPSAIVIGNCIFPDCSGSCYGTAELDACGICEGPNEVNDNGFVTGPDADCAGFCFGSAYWADQCGLCVGGNTGVSDCLYIQIPDSIYEISEESVNLKFPLFAAEIPPLESLDFSLSFNTEIFQITGVNLAGTSLENNGYIIESQIENVQESLNIIHATVYANNLEELFSSTTGDTTIIANLIFNPVTEDTADVELIFSSLYINEIDFTNQFEPTLIHFDIAGCMSQGEQYDDANSNNVYDDGENFVDANSNGVWDEYCNYNENANIESACYIVDCEGSCNGEAVLDACENCNGDCMDNGSGFITCYECLACETIADECGLCGGDNSTCSDCAGIPNGIAGEDNCEICVCNGQDPNIGSGCLDIDPCVQDCNDDWGGDAYDDGCGFCVAGNTTLNDCLSGHILSVNAHLDFMDSIIVPINIHNLPTTSLEGIELEIGFDAEQLTFIDASMDGTVLDNTIFWLVDTTFTEDNEGTYLGIIYQTSSDIISGTGDILHLQFSADIVEDIDTEVIFNSLKINDHPILQDSLNSGTIFLWLKIDDNKLPINFELFQNYPNPFNPVTNIHYQVPDLGYLEINIYNLEGREVTQLISGFHNPGFYTKKWDGTNNKGVSLPTGIYFYSLESKSNIIKKKMILLK